MREDPAGVAGERGEHPELLGRELEIPARERRLVGRNVHPRGPADEHLFLGPVVVARVAQRDPDTAGRGDSLRPGR